MMFILLCLLCLPKYSLNIGLGKQPHEKQATVSIQYKDGYTRHICTGVVISNHHVITTCSNFSDFDAYGYLIRSWTLKENPLVVMAGTKDFRSSNAVYKSDVIEMSMHPLCKVEYPEGIVVSDIGILCVKDRIYHSEFLTKVYVPQDNVPFSELTKRYLNRDLLLRTTSWGNGFHSHSTETYLKAIDVIVLSNNECSSIFCFERNCAALDDKLCAVSIDWNDTLCAGDSGAPLVLKIGGAGALIGVGINTGTCDVRGISLFNKIDNALPWIHDVIRNDEHVFVKKYHNTSSTLTFLPFIINTFIIIMLLK